MSESGSILMAIDTQEQFEYLLNEWHSWAIASELSPMEKVAKTIKNHRSITAC